VNIFSWKIKRKNTIWETQTSVIILEKEVRFWAGFNRLRIRSSGGLV
jgi:hypothetical protein